MFGRHFSRCRRKSVSMHAGLIWGTCLIFGIGLSSVAVSLSSQWECLPGSSSGQRVVVTGVGVVSPYGTDKEAMGGEEGGHVLTAWCSAMMQLLAIVWCLLKWNCQDFYQNLLEGKSVLFQALWFCGKFLWWHLLIAVHPEAIKRITKFDPEAMNGNDALSHWMQTRFSVPGVGGIDMKKYVRNIRTHIMFLCRVLLLRSLQRFVTSRCANCHSQCFNAFRVSHPPTICHPIDRL